MADTAQTIALINLGQRVRGKIVRQINRRSVLLRALPIVPGTGKNLCWDVQGSGQNVENFSEGADASNFTSDSIDQAVLQWARVRSNFHLTGSARRAARSNTAGPDDFESLIMHNMETAAMVVASKVNLQLFSGDGTSDSLTGLDSAIGSVSNTYATLDRTVKTYWQPYVVDPGISTKLSFDQIRTDLAGIYNACGEPPDIAMCSTDVHRAVGRLFDANREYVNLIQTPRGPVTLDAGYAGLYVDGTVFIRDKDATAGQIYYLNSNYLRIEYQPLDPEIMAALEELGMIAEVDDGYGMLPLGMLCEKLAKTGDSDKYQCLTELNLKVDRPNAMGIRKNVATT